MGCVNAKQIQNKVPIQPKKSVTISPLPSQVFQSHNKDKMAESSSLAKSKNTQHTFGNIDRNTVGRVKRNEANSIVRINMASSGNQSKMADLQGYPQAFRAGSGSSQLNNSLKVEEQNPIESYYTYTPTKIVNPEEIDLFWKAGGIDDIRSMIPSNLNQTALNIKTTHLAINSIAKSSKFRSDTNSQKQESTVSPESNSFSWIREVAKEDFETHYQLIRVPDIQLRLS